MLITPFIGLSVLVHVGIIFVYWLFSWVPKKEIRFRKSTVLTRIASTGIIVAIFAIVIIPSGLFMKAIIIDKHSSIKFIAYTISQIEQPKFATAAVASSTIISKKNLSPEEQYSNPVIISLLKSTNSYNQYIYQSK
jgi:hypothetical protein